jgi:hypothetical protein
VNHVLHICSSVHALVRFQSNTKGCYSMQSEVSSLDFVNYSNLAILHGTDDGSIKKLNVLL